MPLHIGKGRTTDNAIRAIIDYVQNPQKTDSGRLITSYQCSSQIADAEFLMMKRQYLTVTGRTRGEDDVIAYHLRQAFVPGEITPEEANRLGCELAHRFTKGRHAFVVCTHIDKAHIHNHIIWSAVDIDCERKFRNFWGSTRAVRQLSDTICIKNGYSIIENPKAHGKSYNKWLGESAKPNHKQQLQAAIDIALLQKPDNLDALLKQLEQAGFEVKQRGKSITLRAKDWQKCTRLNSLGEAYTAETLQAVLSGKRLHTPCKTARQIQPTRPNLIIDIQAKLQAGKGAGYERWAKVFNLKQMAKTLEYLQEHNLLDYAELTQKADEATARYNGLSTQIKAAEKRMAEIAVLQKHIVNYAKTRDTYVAYRKAGYSKKFLELHETEILLHKAAKAAFNEQNLKALPSIKSLRAEYSKLLDEKKVAYAEYRRSRDEMRELLTIKSNVDHILGDARQQKEKTQQTEL